MLEFLGELLVEVVLGPIISLVLAAAWWLVRTGALLALYPLLLATGWLRVWLRGRGRSSLGALWQAHGPAGLHRFGWAEAALDVEYACVTLLLVLAAAGLGAVFYAAGSLVFL